MDCSDQAQSKDLGQVDGSEQPTLDLAKQIMYDAMIADLGTIRMNTLPLEDGSHNYTIPLNVVKQPVPTDQTLAWHSFGNTEASNADQKLDPIANGNLFRSRENANGGNISKSEDKPGQRGRGGLRRGGPRQVGRVSFEDSPTQDQSSGAAKLGNLSIRSKTSSISNPKSPTNSPRGKRGGRGGPKRSTAVNAAIARLRNISPTKAPVDYNAYLTNGDDWLLAVGIKSVPVPEKQNPPTTSLNAEQFEHQDSNYVSHPETISPIHMNPGQTISSTPATGINSRTTPAIAFGRIELEASRSAHPDPINPEIVTPTSLSTATAFKNTAATSPVSKNVSVGLRGSLYAPVEVLTPVASRNAIEANAAFIHPTSFSASATEVAKGNPPRTTESKLGGSNGVKDERLTAPSRKLEKGAAGLRGSYYASSMVVTSPNSSSTPLPVPQVGASATTTAPILPKMLEKLWSVKLSKRDHAHKVLLPEEIAEVRLYCVSPIMLKMDIKEKKVVLTRLMDEASSWENYDTKEGIYIILHFGIENEYFWLRWRLPHERASFSSHLSIPEKLNTAHQLLKNNDPTPGIVKTQLDKYPVCIVPALSEATYSEMTYPDGKGPLIDFTEDDYASEVVPQAQHSSAMADLSSLVGDDVKAEVAFNTTDKVLLNWRETESNEIPALQKNSFAKSAIAPIITYPSADGCISSNNNPLQGQESSKSYPRATHRHTNSQLENPRLTQSFEDLELDPRNKSNTASSSATAPANHSKMAAKPLATIKQSSLAMISNTEEDLAKANIKGLSASIWGPASSSRRSAKLSGPKANTLVDITQKDGSRLNITAAANFQAHAMVPTNLFISNEDGLQKINVPEMSTSRPVGLENSPYNSPSPSTSRNVAPRDFPYTGPSPPISTYEALATSTPKPQTVEIPSESSFPIWETFYCPDPSQSGSFLKTAGIPAKEFEQKILLSSQRTTTTPIVPSKPESKPSDAVASRPSSDTASQAHSRSPIRAGGSNIQPAPQSPLRKNKGNKRVPQGLRGSVYYHE